MHSVPAGSGMIEPAEGEIGRHTIALGCFASICRDRLADELLAFSRVCPNVDIGVHEMPRGALLPALRMGDLSLAVLPGKDEPGVRSAELWQDRVMVAMPADHRLAGRESIRSAELRDEAFLVSRQQFGSDMHRFLARLILPLGPVLNATIIDLGLPRILSRVAECGGITLICESHIEHVGADIVARPIDAPGAVFPVRAYWKDAEAAWPLSALIDSLTATS